MLYSFIELFSRLGLPKIKNDDFYDRLSRRYSIVVLGVSFTLIAATQFLGKPIHCFTQMVDSTYKVDYVNWVCWISSSYYLPFTETLPNRTQSPPAKIPYYQWVPFIICSMMVMFYLPGSIWRRMNRNSGIDVKVVTNMVIEMDQLNSEKRKDAMDALVKQIDQGLTYHRDYYHGFMFSTWKRYSWLCCCSLGKKSGNYLAFGYIIVKLIYIANTIGQVFLLNLFMGTRFHLYGIEVLKNWFHGGTIEAVEVFPRITMCRFSLRTLGDNIQPYEVQCLLPINIFNEKIFLMIWFWLPFVAIMSVYGLLQCLYYFTLDSRKNFIRRFLEVNRIGYNSVNTTSFDMEMLRSFVDRYCRQDGILLLRIVHANINNVLVGELICGLWDRWNMQRKVRFELLPQHPDTHKDNSFNDHDNHKPGLVPSKQPIPIIHDDHYAAIPTRIV